jgi:hypothetical protein
MANKTTANWTQYVGEKRPTSVVYTRKNTPLNEWKEMVVKELVKISAVNLKLNLLSALHSWENDNTPYSYAYILWQREVRAKNREENKLK